MRNKTAFWHAGILSAFVMFRQVPRLIPAHIFHDEFPEILADGKPRILRKTPRLFFNMHRHLNLEAN